MLAYTSAYGLETITEMSKQADKPDCEFTSNCENAEHGSIRCYTLNVKKRKGETTCLMQTN